MTTLGMESEKRQGPSSLTSERFVTPLRLYCGPRLFLKALQFVVLLAWPAGGAKSLEKRAGPPCDGIACEAEPGL